MTEQNPNRRAPLVASVPGPTPQPRQELTAPKQNGPVQTQVIQPPAPSSFAPMKIGHLAKAIAGVMSEVGTIKKGGRNRFHGYDYARMEDLLVAVTPLMGKHGIVVIQNEVERNVVEGNRLAVTYEFSIIHESGEYWPERPRYTGMSMARDSKGNWDDKSVAKCHTAARKYFLLGLFQVPSGDFDDPDADEGHQQEKEKTTDRRVPGPPPAKPAPKAAAAPAPTPPADPPHRIILGAGGGPEKWTEEFIKLLGTAQNSAQLQEWEDLNDNSLQTLSDKYPEFYNRITIATQRRLDDLAAPKDHTGAGFDPTVMPDPKSQEAMNWVAQRLLDAQSYEAAEAFWNEVVAPREAEFEPVDWELLMKEWQRTELRLAPTPPEAT